MFEFATSFCFKFAFRQSKHKTLAKKEGKLHPYLLIGLCGSRIGLLNFLRIGSHSHSAVNEGVAGSFS